MPVGWMKPPRGAILRVGHPMARGLEAAYLFNENSGATLFDYSRNGRNGTIVGATWVSTERGPALNFNGSSDYVDLGAASAFGLTSTSLMTLTAVCASSLATNSGMIVNAGDGASLDEWGLYHYGGGVSDVLYGNLGNQYPTSSAKFGTNVWRTVSLTNSAASGNRVRLYMDGALASVPQSGGTATGSTNVAIGRRGARGLLHFAGRIAAVFIHSRALAAAEIAQLHARPYDMFAR